MPGGANLQILITAKDLASREFKSAGKGLENLASGAQKAANMISLATAPIVALGVVATKMAMDAVESENLFSVSVGDMANSARKWSEDLRTQLGLNAYEVRKNVSTFNVMFDSMGMGKSAAFDMAKGLTQLSYDMASFYNLRPDEAFTKLQAGISGEIEPLKRLGIVINETTIKQYALGKGFIKAGQEMSEAQKAVVRYALIMDQTAKAQGDLARTKDSPANQMRILRAQIDQAAIDLGMVFLPAMQDALGWVSKEGMPAVKQALENGTNAWNGMSTEARNGLITTAALMVGGGPIIGALTGVSKAVYAVGTAFSGATIKAAGLAIGVLAIGAAGEAAMYAATAGADKFGERFKSNLGNMGNEIQGAIDQLAGMVVQDQAVLNSSKRIYDIKKRLHDMETEILGATKQKEMAEKDVQKSLGSTVTTATHLNEEQKKALDIESTAQSRLNALVLDRLALQAELGGLEKRIGGQAVEAGLLGVNQLREMVMEAVNLKNILGTGKKSLGMGIFEFDEYEAAFMAGKNLKKSVGDISGEQKKGIDIAALWAQAEKLAAKETTKAKISVQEYIQALIALHPATAATATAVEAWKSKLNAVNLALIANRDQMKAAQLELQRMQEGLGGLNEKLTLAKQKLTDLSMPKLTGQGEAEKEISQLEGFLKRIELSKVSGRSLGDILKEFPSSLPKGFEWVFNLPTEQMQEVIQNLLQQKRLAKELTFDDQLAKLKQAAEGAKQELSFEDALTQITATKAEISLLTGQIGLQEAAMKTQRAAIDAVQSSGDTLNATLSTYQERLQDAETKQRLVNEALSDAYQWFLDDRQKMIEMGGEAVTQADIVDRKTRELLGAISTFAGDTSNKATTALATTMTSYKSEIAKAIEKVGDLILEINKIPDRQIFLDIIQRQSAQGLVPTTSGASASGITWTGDLIVQGNVTSEQELRESLRSELLKMGTRNIDTGL